MRTPTRFGIYLSLSPRAKRIRVCTKLPQSGRFRQLAEPARAEPRPPRPGAPRPGHEDARGSAYAGCDNASYDYELR